MQADGRIAYERQGAQEAEASTSPAARDAHGKELQNDLLSTTTPGTTSLRSRFDTHQPRTRNAAPTRMNVHLHAISGMTVMQKGVTQRSLDGM
eukprot:2060509-Rhodomonas_salina.1